jgi:hypothetical protein
MSMVCGLDLHRQQITFDALETESGEVWRGRVWQPDRQRFRRWLSRDVARRADGQPVATAVDGCTGWRALASNSNGTRRAVNTIPVSWSTMPHLRSPTTPEFSTVASSSGSPCRDFTGWRHSSATCTALLARDPRVSEQPRRHAHA